MLRDTSTPAGRKWADLMDKLTADRATQTVIDWGHEWRIVKDVCAGVSWLDPIHDDLMRAVTDCHHAQHWQDVTAFRNSVQLMRTLKAERMVPL